jgi:hypothetical protein
MASEQSAKKKFQSYAIGYFHIDIAEVHMEEGKLYLFVAIRLYQDLKCLMPHDQSSRVGGAYAKLRGCNPACWELTGNDGVNRGRIHDAAAAF